MKTRSKLKFEQAGVDRKLYSELYTDLSADDVVAFMAMSEAERRYVLALQGDVRDTQTPSDELKTYLMDLGS